jgi:hypothetical protein
MTGVLEQHQVVSKGLRKELPEDAIMSKATSAYKDSRQRA